MTNTLEERARKFRVEKWKATYGDFSTDVVSADFARAYAAEMVRKAAEDDGSRIKPTRSLADEFNPHTHALDLKKRVLALEAELAAKDAEIAAWKRLAVDCSNNEADLHVTLNSAENDALCAQLTVLKATPASPQGLLGEAGLLKKEQEK